MKNQILFGSLAVLFLLGAGCAAQSPSVQTSTPSTNVNGSVEGSIDHESEETPETEATEGASTPNTDTSASTDTPVASSKGDVATYTPADVAAHNTKTSCWSIVRGGVYDLTSWIPQHPGGERAILSICGKDGTAAFDSVHEGRAQQEALLATMKIGELAK